MRLIISTFFCALLIALASASGSGSGTNSTCTTDGVTCRIVVNSNQVYALAPNNFDSTSSAAIVMRYDLTLDPSENNQVLPWIGGVDPFGLTAYDYTRPTGCLGCNGPLGYSGPLGSVGNLPNRFHGHTPNNRTHTYANNWCPQANDSTCVYGFAGPLGEKGPLNPYAYYNTMYHLGEGVNWSQDYNINLDSVGIWGVQGPLGATGAFGALGALGPLGFSLQAGVTTLATGVYKVNNVVVRQTSPVQYSADGTVSRIYDLYEMYTKDFALKMTDNDCSFAVDSYQSNPGSKGDGFLFTSNATQWLSINVVPVNLLDDFGLILAVSVDGGSTFSIVSEATSNPYSSSGGLMDFIVTRARPNELFRVTVFQQTNGAPVESGYYLYVAGSGVIEIDSNGAAQTVDLWGPRPQLNGASAFNINGAHQAWIPF